MTPNEPITDSKPTKGLAGKSLWALADQGVLSAGNFLTGWMLARLADREEYGSWAVIFVAILTFNAVQSALISVPMMVIGPTYQESRFRRYVSSMATAQAALVLALSLLSLAAGPLVAHFAKAPQLLAPWSAMSLALIFLHSQEFCRRVLYSKLLMPRVFFLDLLSTTLQLAGLAALWRLGGGQWGDPATPGALSATNALLAMAAATAVGTLAGWLQVRRYCEFSRENLREDLTRSWQLGRPGLGGLFGETLHYQGSLTAISLLIGPAGTALAEIPRLMLAPLNIVHFAGVNVLTPRASQYLATRGRQAFRRNLPKLIGLWLIPFIGYPIVILAAPALWLNLLYGGKWDHAVNLVELAAIGQGIVGLRALPWIVVTAMMRTDLYMRGSIATGLLSVIVTISLVKTHGAGAALWGRLAGDSVMLLAGVAVLITLLREPETDAPAAAQATEGA